MNTKPGQHDELRLLIDAICEQTMTQQQSVRLEEIISSDKNALDFYIQSMWMNDGIRRLSSGLSPIIDASRFEIEHNKPESLEPGNDDMVSATAQQNAWANEAHQVKGNPSKRTRAAGGVSARPFFASIVAMILILAGIATVWFVGIGDKEQVAQRPAKRPTQGLQTNAGALATADLQSEGLRRQVLTDGTIVIARSGAKFNVVQPREINLEKGELFLIVAKSDTPLVVKTDDGEVLATGTRFAVSAGDQTLAAVAQGQVILKSAAGSVALGAGQQGTLAPSQKPTRGPAPRLSHLVNWAKGALKQEELLVEPAIQENGLIAIDPYGQEARLTLRKYLVDVYIEDGIARTTIDQTFFNHNPWNTEGTFYFPLPPNASVSRLAMYVAGQLNEGGMVSRQRGQEIYTEILYQRRDPALLEMMEGNLFKMRIFPLEGRQEKRIFLSYTQNLEELYGTLKYWFPMDHTQETANQLSIRVRVKDGAKQFDPATSTHDIKLTTDGDDLLMEYAAEKVKPDRDFLLSLLRKKDATADETRVATCQYEGQHYLSAKLVPDLPGDHHPEPRQWIVMNDVSASRTRIDVLAQRYVLERLITEADDDDTVFLMDLNTKARNVSVKPVNVRSAAVRPLLNHRPKRLIGATDIAAGLDAVQEVIRKHELKNPYLVYLGDGVATDGEKAISELPRLIPRGCKFVGIGIGKKVDSMFLEEAASQTGGMFTTINPNEDIDWRVFDLLAALNTPRMSNIRVALLDENDEPMPSIAYPSSTVIASGETLTVTAMCDRKLPSKIQFTGRIGQRPVTKTALVKDAKTGANYLPRLWAKQHIDDLLKSGMSNQEEIVELSKAFYVVTPFTSLIVLEDDAMYQQYDVERGRKDHWAKYDAPLTIDVVQEPVEWNRWGWGRFQGEDSKIDASTQPKTIQEIVDGIQVRINAPFYLWQDPPQDSRTELYQICNSDFESETDPTRLLTLWFLLASGQRETLMEWSRQSAPGEGSQAIAPASSAEADGSLLGSTRAVNDLIYAQPGLDEFGIQDGALQQMRQMTLFGEPRTSSLSVSRRSLRLSNLRLPSLERQSPIQKLDFLLKDEITPLTGYLKLASTVPRSSGLDPMFIATFNRAVSNRWNRIQRDVNKYNSQHGGGNWGGQWYGWNESIDLNDDGNPNENNRELQELMADFDGELDELMRPNVNLAGAMDFEFSGRFKPNRESGRLMARDNLFGGEGLDLRGRGFLGGRSSNSALPELSSQLIADQSFFRFPFGRTRGTEVYVGRTTPLGASMFLAASQNPVRNQPGMAAVLAADHLHRRFSELESLSVLDQHQTAEKRAIEVALAKMDRVGARVESSGMFWGYAGWSYQPRPQTVQPPTIQAYPGFAWSFDLTRYAGGLYSNGTDVIHEVSRQYGKRKPAGKIDDASRKLIDDSRSNFEPVSLQFDEAGLELHVGPNDKFAVTHRNDMYLTEKLICDGSYIHQVYDELGISARREASDIRLNELRQLVPHMVAPPESLIENFDVELVKRDENSFTLKLTNAEIPHVSKQPTETGDQEVQTNSTKNGNPGIHWLLTVDHQGRILNRKWIEGEKTILSISFDFNAPAVEMTWEFKSQLLAEKGMASIQTKPLTRSDDMFSANLDQNIVFDMPLMKPSFYANKLAELERIRGAANEDINTEQANRDQLIPLVHGDEAVRLLRHQVLASLQDLDGNPWGQGNAAAMASATELLTLQERLKQIPQRGDVTLCGSASGQISQHPELRDRLNKHASLKNSAIFRFYQTRFDWQAQATQFNDERGLIGHLAAFNAATYDAQEPQFKSFASNFGDSPLALALACSYQSGFKMDRLLKLNDDPRWSAVALLVASARSSSPEDKQKVASAFWKWQEELAKNDQPPVLLDPVLQLIKSVDSENANKISEWLAKQFERVKEHDSLPALLDFAEKLSSWGETSLADEAYLLVRTKLGIQDQESEVPLLKRFAYGQSLWAGNRYEPAWEQFNLVVNSLEEKQIPLSPSFCAAMARLAGQAGKTEQSVLLEERALELEQPHLPNAINLAAFRQRYQWLWNQYLTAIERITKSDPDRESKIDSLVTRATRTWDRWQEVDRENLALPGQMATFLKRAGRGEESWAFLSSVIDQKPRDANSYYQVGQWYREQHDLARAIRWMGEAPQWDTANPQWLFHYGSVLKELGRKDEANVQFNKIINGKWAPGLQNWVDQARNEL